MAQITIKCTVCANDLAIEEEWLGMKMECPICRCGFTAGEKPAEVSFESESAPAKRKIVRKRSGNSSRAQEEKKRLIQLYVKIAIGLILCVCGFLIYLKVTALTPEKLVGNRLEVMTKKRVLQGGPSGMVDIVKADFFTVVNDKKNFFYCEGLFKGVQIDYIGGDKFKGIMVFERFDKKMTRPVMIDRSSNFTVYTFPFKYSEHPEYLKEDADLIFGLAQQIDKELKEWTFSSAEVDGTNILKCKIKNGEREKTITLKATHVMGDDGIDRIWVEIKK